MVDSGCSLSIIKLGLLPNDAEIDKSEIFNLVGIAGGVSALGKTNLLLKFGRKTVLTEFQVIENGIENYDGIIGQNIILNSTIDLKNNILLFNDPDKDSKENRCTIQEIFQNSCSAVENEKTSNTEITGEEEKIDPKLKCNEKTVEKECENDKKRLEDLLNFIENVQATNPAKMFMIEKDPILREINGKQKFHESQRTNEVMNAIETDHLSSGQKTKLTNLVHKYQKIFRFEHEALPACTALTMRLNMKHDSPIFTKQYKLTKEQEDFAEKELESWEKLGILEPSVSPFNSPIIVVEKKTLKDNKKRFRICVDLRKINNALQDCFVSTIPVHEIIKTIPKSRYHTTIDLSASYMQVPIDPKDSHILAITIRNKRYQFTRAPFGLKTSGHLFCLALKTAIEQSETLSNSNCLFYYVDDLLLTANSENEMFEVIEEMFKTLSEFNFSINPSKLEILKESVEFLGHKISGSFISPVNDKVAAVRAFPRPTKPKDILSFIGLANFFRQFIEDFATKSDSLLKLVRKGEKFVWTDEQEASFVAIKAALTSPPLLCHSSELFNPKNLPVLFTDASKISISGVLGFLDENNRLKPVEYFSKLNDKAQKNYSIFELELMAVVFALTKQFKYQISGLNRIVILTDNKGVAQMKTINLEGLEGRILRWVLRLRSFTNCSIVHIAGKKNSMADALSRMRIEEKQTEKAFIVTRGMLKSKQNTDVTMESLKNTDIVLRSEENTNESTNRSPVENVKEIENQGTETQQEIQGTAENVERKGQSQDLFEEFSSDEESEEVEKIENRDQQMELIKQAHHSVLFGHVGISRTLKRLKANFRWKNMDVDVKNYIRSCKACQTCKAQKSPKVPLSHIQQSKKPFDEVFIDHLLLPECEGFRYVLIIVDNCTKFILLRPMTDRKAESVATELIKIFSMFGYPSRIVSDNALEFLSDVMKNAMKLLRIKHEFSTIYNSKSNISERYILTTKTLIRAWLNENNEKNWLSILPIANYSINITPNYTNFSPFELMFGRKSREIYSKLCIRQPETAETYFNNLQDRIRSWNKLAEERSNVAKVYNKKYYDINAAEKNFEIGEFILMKNKSRENTLSELFLGPFEIIDVCSDNVLKIRKGKKIIKIHKDLIVKYKERKLEENPSN